MEVKDAVFDEILDKVLFREKQVSTLLNLFNTRNSFSCGSIFIYGHTATGKNYVLETLFEKLQVSYSPPPLMWSLKKSQKGEGMKINYDSYD